MCTHLFSSSWKSKRLLLICMLKAISQQSSFKWLFFIESVRSTHFKMVNSKTANSKSNSLSCTLKDTWFLGMLSHSSHTFIRTYSSFWESCMNHKTTQFNPGSASTAGFSSFQLMLNTLFGGCVRKSVLWVTHLFHNSQGWPFKTSWL